MAQGAGGRKSCLAQAHALEGSVAQDELMPDGHQGVQAGKDQDKRARVLVEIGDQAGLPLYRCRECRKLDAEERDWHPHARCGVPAGKRQPIRSR